MYKLVSSVNLTEFANTTRLSSAPFRGILPVSLVGYPMAVCFLESPVENSFSAYSLDQGSMVRDELATLHA